ncbi:hypothetical protein QE152_g30237 [Popillia japonica]|uniref:Uncharacterized protein n=1 Tax=Popillia japonica TaxID=7064 RepID=A0AAW1JEW6_POPJA
MRSDEPSSVYSRKSSRPVRDSSSTGYRPTFTPFVIRVSSTNRNFDRQNFTISVTTRTVFIFENPCSHPRINNRVSPPHSPTSRVQCYKKKVRVPRSEPVVSVPEVPSSKFLFCQKKRHFKGAIKIVIPERNQEIKKKKAKQQPERYEAQ